MLPEFLGDFRKPLEQYRLDYVRIKATPLLAGETLSLTQSKFLGHPYLPLGNPYLLDAVGQPMVLWAQLNFAEIPRLAGFPDTSILQFFASATDWYNAEDYRVLYHPDISGAPQTNFSLLTDKLYADSPIYTEHALTFSPAIEYGNPEDVRFDMSFDGKDYYEYQETISEAQREELDTYCNNAGHKLGGYAFFTQGDPRDYSSAGQRSDVQLLQLDSDEQIMFGDSGVAHLFISPEALANRQFEQAYFYWDCC